VDKDTVSIYFVRAAVARLGTVQRERVLQAAGVPCALLATDGARVPAASFATLWMAVTAELNDEFFGLDTRSMKPGSFALLCHAVLHAPGVEAALRRLLRGFALVLDDVQAHLEVDGANAAIVLSNQIAEPAARRFADETLLVMLHGVLCWLVGRRLALVQVDWAHPPAAQAAEYTRMFTQHIRFDAAHTALRFNGAVLRGPVAPDSASLKRFLRDAPQSVFLRYRNPHSWSARVRRCLRPHIGQMLWQERPRIEWVCAQLQVAAATLRRRLADEGTSWQALLDQLRCDAAIHLLCSSHLPLAEIAAQLGYREASAFHRAFKRWSGLQPGEYRQAMRRGNSQGLMHPEPG
jgi:AraC-like DNA-binding protein